MTLQETDNGVEVTDDCACTKEGERTVATLSSSNVESQSKISKSTRTAPTLSSSSSSSPESSSCIRMSCTDSDLEYSDEEASFISTDDDDNDNVDIMTNHKNSDHINVVDDNQNMNVLQYAAASPTAEASFRTLDLVIDEMMMVPSTTTTTMQTNNAIPTTTVSKPIIKPTKANGKPPPPHQVMACPCCRSYVEDCNHHKQKDYWYPINGKENHQNVNDTTKSLSSFVETLLCSRGDGQGGRNHQKGSSSSSSLDAAIVSEENQAKLMKYEIKKVVIEGWLFKKGTGNDFFGSTSWKPRWCSVVMANIPSCNQEVPILLVSWNGSVNPSNVILLESSIAIPIDNNEEFSEDIDNSHCFDIVSTQRNLTLSNGNLARTFSTRLENRNKWVLTINQTIRDYERSKKLSKRLHQGKFLPPTSPTRDRSNDMLDLNGLNIACVKGFSDVR